MAQPKCLVQESLTWCEPEYLEYSYNAEIIYLYYINIFEMNDCDRSCEFCKGPFSLFISGVDLLMKNISKVFTNLDDKIDFIELKMCFEIVRSVFRQCFTIEDCSSLTNFSSKTLPKNWSHYFKTNSRLIKFILLFPILNTRKHFSLINQYHHRTNEHKNSSKQDSPF